MVVCTVYDSSREKEWDSCVDSARAPLFFFKRSYLEYHADRFTDSSLMFYEEDQLIAIMPATVHGDHLVTHGGLTYGGLIYSAKIRAATIGAVFTSFHEWARDRGIQKVTYKSIPYVFHAQPAQEDLYFVHTLLQGKVVRRDLSSVIHLKDRLKLSKGRKWLIARAKKLGLQTHRSTDWESFHALLSDALSRHGAQPVHSVAELKLLAERFPQNIELVAVTHDDRMVSAALLFRFSNVVHTQYLATSEPGKEMGALDYLIESAIQDSSEQGHDFFSFGISTEDQGRVLNEGLVQQKESFGARGMVIDFYEITIK